MLESFNKKAAIKTLQSIVGRKYVITTKWRKQAHTKGWRYGEGDAIAVVKPGTLIEMWKILEVCQAMDLIVIMQAANTGLTGGSTPFGNDYDRHILIMNTMRINDIHILDEGNQIVGFAGSTLFELETKLKTYNREPHSVIGSSCIGASIVGGVCNNSGGALVKRGPAYTELSLYAKIDSNSNLVLVNELGINLGNDPEEILKNLESKSYTKNDVIFNEKLASDNEYSARIRNVEAKTPARFNADTRRLNGASGCAGKVVVFAVRLDTYPVPKVNQVFYLGTNNPHILGKIRKHILSSFKNLPVSGEYLHKDCYDAAKKYSKDTFIAIDRMGPSFIPKLFEFKRRVDLIAKKIRILPDSFSDQLMQLLSWFWPNHLPKRMEDFRRKFNHYWIIEMSDDGILEADTFFSEFFSQNEGSFFKCTEEEAKKAITHRFVAAGSIGRYHAINKSRLGAMLSMDIALPRNDKNWFEELPSDMKDLFDMKLYYGHLFCHVLHQNYILKKGVDEEEVKSKLLKFYEDRGAEYPAEHNVGHEYYAKKSLSDFYMELDPTNSFNPGIGRTSKFKFWK